MNDIIMQGEEKGQSTVAVEYDRNAFRYDSPKKSIVIEKSFALKYKTLMDNASFTLNASMQARVYEVGNPSTKKPEMIWDIRNLRIWSSGIDLPTGYTMWATPVPKRATEKTSGQNTYPAVEIEVRVEVGPVIGTSTAYSEVLVFDPPKGSITK